MTAVTTAIRTATYTGDDGTPTSDPDRFALSLLNVVLGEGMSSRLFMEIRERLSLAYSVDSFVSYLADTGVAGVYAAVAPARLSEAKFPLRWEAVSRAQGYVVSVGAEPGGSEIYQSWFGDAGRAVEVEGLPAGGVVHVRLWTLLDGEWYYRDLPVSLAG